MRKCNTFTCHNDVDDNGAFCEDCEAAMEREEMELLPAHVVSVAHADALRRKARKLMRTIDRAQKHALDSKEPYGSHAGIDPLARKDNQ